MGEQAAASWEGKPCPKCAYVRTAADRGPAWRCPRCEIAYVKYNPEAAAAMRARLAAEGRAMASQAAADRSLLVLVASNLVALGVAYASGMTLRHMMLVYWMQSVVIGVTTFIRILSLRRFDVTGVTINDQPVEETDATRRWTAYFFLLHYGLFHVAYFVFVVFESEGALGSFAGYALCALIFAANHGYSLAHNLRRDAAGQPNIGTLMQLPYARIVPMHLVTFVGGHVPGGTLAFFVFGLLKTAADVLMHVVEHYVLRKARP